MYIELEIGDNLKDAIGEFCRRCEDKYNLGSNVESAFGIDFVRLMEQNKEMQNLIVTVERRDAKT